jgi:hypothetical protein
MLRGHESRPHCHDTVLRYAVTLQVCTQLNPHIKCEQTAEVLREYPRTLLLAKNLDVPNLGRYHNNYQQGFW